MPAPDQLRAIMPSRLREIPATARVLLGAKARARGALVLAYHDIGDDATNTTDYYVSPSQMRRQLLMARRAGLRFVSLEQLTEKFREGRDLDGLGAVVFDDSLAGVHHHAMPVLLELGVPATVFTVSAALGEDPAWWPGAARVMTSDEVREMADCGFTIASHTRTHCSLAGVSASVRVDEIVGSRSELEDLVGKRVDLFAYPFGHYDRDARESVEGAGYNAAYSFLNGRITEGLDRFRLPRLNMWSGQGRLRLAYHLARSAGSWPDTQLEEVGG